MKKLLLPLVCLFSLSVQGKSYKVAKITSELDENITEFFVETNEDNKISSMRYVTILPNGGISEDISVPAEVIIEEGAVISHHDGFDAVKLKVENFNVNKGGTIILDYLYNGISGVRKNKKITLKNTPDETHLVDDQKPINRMYFKVNRTFPFGVVGVKSVSTSFENEISVDDIPLIISFH